MINREVAITTECKWTHLKNLVVKENKKNYQIVFFPKLWLSIINTIGISIVSIDYQKSL